MRLKAILVFTFLFANDRSASCTSYDNYALYSVIPETKQQLYFFHALGSDKSMNVSFWAQPGSLHHAVNLIVPPDAQAMFLTKAKSHGIAVTTLLENVQEAFDAQTVKPYTRRSMDTFNWKSYYKLEDIYSWLEDVARVYSDRAKLVSMGTSAEGRKILGIRIDCKLKTTCKDIFIEGGIHAREWISPAFVTYLIYQLVRAQEIRTNEIIYAVRSYNWHIFPVVNPDGYIYTHTVDRQWRKNRRKTENGRFGVDLNRNFDYKFNTVGVSRNPSEETYCGPKAFSEPESKAISKYISHYGDQIEFYLSFHSYGQYFIIPYANAQNHKDNYNEVKRLAQKAMKVVTPMFNTNYKIGNAYETVGYVVSGNSADWAKKTFNITISANIELRDKGKYGFALPAKFILPTCEETMVMVLEMIVSSKLSRSSVVLSQDVQAKLTSSSNEMIYLHIELFAVVILNLLMK